MKKLWRKFREGCSRFLGKKSGQELNMALLLLVIVALILGYKVVQPWQQQALAAKKATAKLELEQQRVEQFHKQHPAFTGEYQQRQQQLAKLKQELPDKLSALQIEQNIYTAANKYGVVVKSLKLPSPQAEKKVGPTVKQQAGQSTSMGKNSLAGKNNQQLPLVKGLEVYTSTLTIEGEYGAVVRFLKQLEAEHYSLDKLTLSATKLAGVVNCSVKVQTYVLP